MTLIKLNNQGMVRRMANESFRNSLMNDYMGTQKDCVAQSEPKYQTIEMDDKFVLQIAVPGLSKDDLMLGVENSILTIKTVERDLEQIEGFAALTFEKQFRLSRKVNQDAIEAQTKNGVLIIDLPKVPEEIKKPARQVEIM